MTWTLFLGPPLPAVPRPLLSCGAGVLLHPWHCLVKHHSIFTAALGTIACQGLCKESSGSCTDGTESEEQRGCLPKPG